MNREEYLACLALCFKLETAGAIAGEVAMLLREDPLEKAKLDLFRRLEASNKILCVRAFQKEGVIPPTVEGAYYRNGIKLGQKLGSGDWDKFLDHFEATINTELFSSFLLDNTGNEIVHLHDGVDVNLLRHLVRHELSLEKFVALERKGYPHKSASVIESLLESDLCVGLVGPQDPVGW